MSLQTSRLFVWCVSEPDGVLNSSDVSALWTIWHFKWYDTFNESVFWMNLCIKWFSVFIKSVLHVSVLIWLFEQYQWWSKKNNHWFKLVERKISVSCSGIEQVDSFWWDESNYSTHLDLSCQRISKWEVFMREVSCKHFLQWCLAEQWEFNMADVTEQYWISAEVWDLTPWFKQWTQFFWFPLQTDHISGVSDAAGGFPHGRSCLSSQVREL